MTAHTVIGKDPRNLITISNRSVGLGLLDSTNQATRCGLVCARNRITLQQTFNCIHQIVRRWLFAHKANSILIIDTPVVTHRSLLVQQKDFGRPSCSQRCDQRLLIVFRKRIGHRMAPRMGRHFRQRILLIRIDTDDRHTL